jgi:two-component system chemotaxis response regulator CheB
VRVVHGPKQNRHRPAVDVLFRSAAFAHGPRTIGVVLTGSLSDGAAGLAAIKRAGGVAVVHDPADAAYPEMPGKALAEVVPDHVVAASGVAPLLASLVGQEIVGSEVDDVRLEIESDADRGLSDMDRLDAAGKRSVFTCPDCHGTLWELGEGDVMQFRCHVGHGFSAEALAARQDEKLEDTMWAAVRAMEENARLSRRVNARLGSTRLAEDLVAKADSLERHANLLRRVINRQPR